MASPSSAAQSSVKLPALLASKRSPGSPQLPVGEGSRTPTPPSHHQSPSAHALPSADANPESLGRSPPAAALRAPSPAGQPNAASDLQSLKALLRNQSRHLKREDDRGDVGERAAVQERSAKRPLLAPLGSPTEETVMSGARYTAHLHSPAQPPPLGVSGASEDEEVMRLRQQLAAQEARMNSRSAALRRQWMQQSSSPEQTTSIPPPSPPVLAASSDEEVTARATAAQSFAENMTRLHRSGRSGSHESPPLGDWVDASKSSSPSSGRSTSPEPRECCEQSMASLTLSRLSMRASSMARATDGAVAMLEMLTNRPDVILPSPSEVGVVRSGDVLSSRYLLKIDLQDAFHNRRGPTGIIAGAPYFRIVPKFNVAGVAQADVSAITTIMNELRRARVEGPVCWVNLREEPLVYINNAAHIVRERQDPTRPVIIPNVTGRSIEMVELKLKREVLCEAEVNGGNVSVYMEGKDGIMEDQWESVEAQGVLTLAEVFERVAQRNKDACDIRYYRRPITQNIGPQPPDFDFVLDACLEEPKAVFVFNCQSGRGRTSAMMQVATIVRFYQFCVKDVSVDVRMLRGNISAPTFRTIQKLVSLFPDGKLHERRLLTLMGLSDKVYSMAAHINDAFTNADSNPEVAMMRLQLYAYFLVFSYYCEQRLWNYATKLSFTQWLAENPDMMLLITSVREKLDDQLREECIVAPVAHGAEAEVARKIRHRSGNVLSAGRILCSLPMEKEKNTIQALRQLAADVPIFTCGRVGRTARKALVRHIREAFPGQRRFHWLSLRAEPMVLVNDVSYTLTDYSAPPSMTETGTTMHISLQAIEQLEDRLRRDVLLEAQESGGYVLLHHMNTEGHRTVERVKVRSVRTPRSTMEDFIDECQIVYHRIPIPFSGHMLATDLDPLVQYLAEYSDGLHITLINDSEGTTRATVALNMLTIYRASRCADLRTIQSSHDLVQLLRVGDTGELLPAAHLASAMPVDKDDVPTDDVQLLVASTICQMLTAGSLLPTVDAVVALGGRGRSWNLLHAVDYLKRRISVLGADKPQRVVEALHGVRSYLLVLLFALYLDDQGDYSPSCPFSAWIAARGEVANIIDHLDSRGQAALRYVAADNLMKADVLRRTGDVLTANFCLKADHFPGCQKKGLRPELCGAPNFRKVHTLNVYGVAIPTLLGIHNVLALLGASAEPLQVYAGQRNDAELYRGFAAPRLFDPNFKPEQLHHPLRGSVVWINMREEPILYVGDRPFVFRDLAAPYVNVELTGIQTDKIEHVEERLKVDVLHEAGHYNGRFLVHDEGSPGELVGQWETASAATVKTLREVYEELKIKGFRCLMLRLPVTDEQSPDIQDFDHLVVALLPRIARHLDRRETLSFVFNCQMGRGRTTTGMVICCLLIGLVIPEYYEELDGTFQPLYKEGDSEFARGEYDVIVQLKRVLTAGRQAKHHVDLVLEACSKMQNLRTAIEGFVIAVRSPDNTEAARARAHHAGVHYLIRYFNLIVFAVYLEEEYDRMRKVMRMSFVQWMQLHPELVSLSLTSSLK